MKRCCCVAINNRFITLDLQPNTMIFLTSYQAKIFVSCLVSYDSFPSKDRKNLNRILISQAMLFSKKSKCLMLNYMDEKNGSSVGEWSRRSLAVLGVDYSSLLKVSRRCDDLVSYQALLLDSIH